MTPGDTDGYQGSKETIGYQAFDSWKNITQKKYEAIKRYFAEASRHEALNYLVHLMLHEVIKIDVIDQREPRFRIILRRWDNDIIVREEDITKIVEDAFLNSKLDEKVFATVGGKRLSDEDIRKMQFPLLLTILSEWVAGKDVGLPLSFQELKERAALEEATSSKTKERKIHFNTTVRNFLYHILRLMNRLLHEIVKMQKGDKDITDSERIVSSVVSQLNSSLGPKIVSDALSEAVSKRNNEQDDLAETEEEEERDREDEVGKVKVKVKVNESIQTTSTTNKPGTAHTEGGGSGGGGGGGDDGRKPSSTTGIGGDDKDKGKEEKEKKEPAKPDLNVHKEDFNFVESLVKKVDVPTKPIFHAITKELAWDIRVKLEIGRRLFPSLMFYFQDLIKPEEFLDPEKLGSRLAYEMVAIVDYYQKSGVNIHELISEMEKLRKEIEEYRRSYKNLIFAINQLRNTLIQCSSCGYHMPVGPNIVGTLITMLATRKFAYDILQDSTEAGNGQT
jgi:hypothetical protein